MAQVMSPPRYLALLLLGSGLAACAGGADRYPSLAIRDAERVQGTFEVAEAPPPQPLGADTLASIDSLVSDARAAHSEFMSAAPRATVLVRQAQGAAVASNQWGDAQVALSNLDSQRSLAAIPLGSLDLLYAHAAISLEQRAAIDEARNAVIALLEEEDLVLAQLRGTLK